MTNLEKIKSLSEKEMLEFLERFENGDIDYSLTHCSICENQLDCIQDCLKSWLRKTFDPFDYDERYMGE